MSFAFLSPDGAGGEALARSPMERQARAAGARLEVRDGWNVAVGYTSVEQECEGAARSAAWADVSHLGKLQVQAPPEDLATIAGGPLELGHATRVDGAWLLPLTAARALVVCDAGRVSAARERLIEAAAAAGGPATVLDLTTAYAALTLVGPQARELFARFSAIDLRPRCMPVRGFRPGSIARSPGMVVCEDTDRFLVLIGAALGQYLWSVVADAGRHLGGSPIGVDALAPLPEAAAAAPEASPHA